jgi:mannose-6-phosphate isomerase-like protein (cupin superfamily)
MGDYTIKRLTEVKDVAPDHGFGDYQEARFAKDELGTADTGVAMQFVKRQAFAHRHDKAEEVYVVIAGSGRVKLDDDVVELRELDALRVAPTVTRQFEADSEGLRLLAFGPRHDRDGEIIPGWWSD